MTTSKEGSLLYDDIGEPGVLVDNVRRQLPFDAAADDGGATGGTDGALSDPTDAQASPTPRRSPWAVSDDHETGEAATLQAGLDYSDDQWLKFQIHSLFGPNVVFKKILFS